MWAVLSTLAVYGATAAAALWLAHRFVLPIPRRAALLLVAAPLLFTGRAIFTGGILAPLDIAYQAEPLHSVASEYATAHTVNPLLVDVVSQMLPWRAAVREAAAEGRFPLWNRYVLAGEPLHGVAQPAIFNPGTWIGLLLPMPQAWNFDISLRLLIALSSAYLFFRGIAASQVPALLGAAAWAFSAFLLFFVGYPLAPSVAPFPLLALGLLRLVKEGSRRAVGLTVCALVLSVVAGHPETLLFSVFGGGLFFLGELAAAGPGRRLRPVLLCLVAGGLALGLAGVVLLPFLEILPQTRQYVMRGIPHLWGSRSEPLLECLRRLLPSIVPYAYGALGRSDIVGRLIVPAGYAGSLLFPFAAAGLSLRSRRRWVFLGLALSGLALNVRLPGVAGPLAKLPLFDIAVNDYLIFLTVFGLAGLAVLGAEGLLHGEGARPFLAGTVITLAALLAVTSARAAGMIELGMSSDYLRYRVLLQIVPVLGAASLVAVLARRGRLGAPAVVLLSIVFVGERRLEEAETYPTYPERAFYPPLKLLDPIPRGTPVRMVSLFHSFTPNIGAVYGVEDVRGYEAMTFGPLADTFDMWCVQMPAYYNRVDDPTSPFLAFLGARYVLFPPGIEAPAGWRVLAEEHGSRLIENPRALPRAFSPAHVAWVGDQKRAAEVLRTIQSFASDGIVGRARSAPPHWLPNGPADVKIVSYSSGRMALRIESKAPVFIGTSVTAWKGWKLRLDGSRAPLLPFNHAFLGFEAPAGRHEAILRYEPDGYRYGAAISGATLLLLGVSLLRVWRGRVVRGRRA